MTKILLDTDVVINLLKKDRPYLEKFLSLDSDGAIFYCNPIVVAEIYAGAFSPSSPFPPKIHPKTSIFPIN